MPEKLRAKLTLQLFADDTLIADSNDPTLWNETLRSILKDEAPSKAKPKTSKTDLPRPGAEFLLQQSRPPQRDGKRPGRELASDFGPAGDGPELGDALVDTAEPTGELASDFGPAGDGPELGDALVDTRTAPTGQGSKA